MASAPSLNELIQTVRDRSAGQDPLTLVSVAAEVSGEIASKADVLLGHFVSAARQGGCSWAEIGTALGVTKQGAQQRFVSREAATRATEEQLLERYTGRARACLAHASDEAVAMGHNYVGTEHLLLGVIGDRAALSVRVLDALRVSVDDLRQDVIAAAGPSPPVRATDPPTLTPRARRVLDLAKGEALRLSHNYIGTEHLLMALVEEGDGVAGRVLRERGLETEQVRAEVVRALSGSSDPAAR